jgi:hypothetical protein
MTTADVEPSEPRSVSVRDPSVGEITLPEPEADAPPAAFVVKRRGRESVTPGRRRDVAR